MDARLSLHPTGWKPRECYPYVFQPLAGVFNLRIVAWRCLEFRAVGRLSWLFPGCRPLVFTQVLQMLGKFPSVIITFVITLVGWVLFRSESMDQLWHFVGGMFSFRGGETVFVNQSVWMTMLFAALFAALAYSPK